MSGKPEDVVRGSAMIVTGPVDVQLDLKTHRVTVGLDTNHDGTIDTAVVGELHGGITQDALSDMLYRDAVKFNQEHGKLQESDVRSLGIEARGMNDISRGRE